MCNTNFQEFKALSCGLLSNWGTTLPLHRAPALHLQYRPALSYPALSHPPPCTQPPCTHSHPALSHPVLSHPVLTITLHPVLSRPALTAKSLHLQCTVPDVVSSTFHSSLFPYQCLHFSLFVAILGRETRSLHMLGKYFLTELHHCSSFYVHQAPGC